MADFNGLQFIVQDINNSSSTVKISADKAFIAKTVGRDSPYRNLPAKFGPALEKVGDYVRTSMIPKTFHDEGPGWAPLAWRTRMDRAAGGYGPAHPILRRSGDLYRELTEKSHPKHIEIIKTGKYARIELGGSSVKFIQNQLGEGDPGQKLPRRPMIPGTGNLRISERDRLEIKRILVNSIKASLR